MRTLAVTALFCLWSSVVFAFDQQHAAWNQVLQRYVGSDGRVAYSQLKADFDKDKQHPLRIYSQDLETVTAADFATWPAPVQKAFLINAYNALTVKLLVEHYPVESLKDLGGFFTSPWKIDFFSLLGGKAKALDTIEHELLRPVYKDYRIHAAVNCASVSCPQLRSEAYVGERLDAQLDAQMQSWLADPSRNHFDPANHKVELSKIFKWYEQDFIDWGGSVANVLQRYGPPAAKAALSGQPQAEITYLDYDWHLNDKR